MRPFVLEPKMLTMSGVFYPTGYIFAMFPSEDEARKAGHALLEDGSNGEEVSLLTPDVIHDQIGRTIGYGRTDMPSAGTEADTVRQFADLAGKGHHALMIRAPSAAETQHVMTVLHGSNISYAQKYRRLVIEDLV